MAEPISAALAVGVTGAIFEGIGSIFGGTPPPAGELFKLPFEMEIEFLNQTNRNLTELNKSFDKINSAVKAYDQRLATYTSFLEGQLPEAGVQEALSRTANDIAGLFGGSAAEAIKNGFLDEDSARYAGLIEEREGQFVDRVQSIRDSQFGSDSLDAQFEQERQRTIQELTRNGASPAAINFSLASLKRDQLARAEDTKLRHIDSLRGDLDSSTRAIGTAAQTTLAGRQQGFNQAVSSFDVLQRQLASNNQVAAGIAGAAGERFSAANVGIQTSTGLANATSGQFQSFGALADSKELRRQMAAGTVQVNAGLGSSRVNDPNAARAGADQNQLEQQVNQAVQQASRNGGLSNAEIDQIRRKEERRFRSKT